MSFFSPSQRKILLAVWASVLSLLYAAVVFMGSTDTALVASYFVIVPMQITCIAYFIGGFIALLLWLFGGRQRNMRDYAIIMLVSAIIFAFLLRDAPLDYWQSL